MEAGEPVGVWLSFGWELVRSWGTVVVVNVEAMVWWGRGADESSVAFFFFFFEIVVSEGY